MKSKRVDGGLIVERRVSHSRKRKGNNIKKQPNRLLVLSRKYGNIRLLVKGANGIKALSAISKLARVRDVVLSSEGTYVTVPSKVCDQIIALLNNLCYDYKIISYGGAVPTLIGILARFGLAVGLLLSIVMMGLYPNLVTRIEVGAVDMQSIDGALNARIFDILASNGVREGELLFGLDCDSVSKQLLGIDGVAFAGVVRRGTHINVLIKREERPENFVSIEGAQVRAKKLATVTRVIVHGGTAAVKYGDVVDVGDVLIDSYTMYGDERVDAEAAGIVYGKVYLKKSVYFPDERIQKRYGGSKRITKLSMFSIAPKIPKPPYEVYELETHEEQLGFLLPFKIYTFTYRELLCETTREERSEEELGNMVYSDIMSELEEAARVLDKYVEVERDESGVKITVTVEAEEMIS